MLQWPRKMARREAGTLPALRRPRSNAWEPIAARALARARPRRMIARDRTHAKARALSTHRALRNAHKKAARRQLVSTSLIGPRWQDASASRPAIFASARLRYV